MPRRRSAALLLLALPLLAGACAAGDSDDAATQAGAEERAPSAGDGDGEVASGGGGAAPQAPGGAPLPVARSLIQRGDVSLRVDDVDAAVDAAIAAAERAGGFLSGQQVTRNDDSATGLVRLRVPSTEFADLLDELSGLGELLSRTVDTDDVTDQVVDLESRLRTARASLERVRALLGQAATIDEIVRLESEVSSRETLVEQLEGQLAVLRDQVALSDITVRLGEEVPPPPSEDPVPSEDIPGFLSGLKHGWVALVNVVGIVLTVLGAVLPFLLPAAPVIALLLWLRRRRRTGTPA